jgi:hypothetical protein
MQPTRRSRSHDPASIGAVIEAWLDELRGPERLGAFRELPESMQRGAWAGLRRQIDLEREREQAA